MPDSADGDPADAQVTAPPPADHAPITAIGGFRLRAIKAHAKWRHRDEGRDLGFAWILTALVGFTVIHLGGTGTSIVPSLLPVLVMVLYLWFGLTRQTRNLTRLADSVYFLGFLWTLFALIDTLIGRGNQVRAADVFTVFGYALVTTAAGMFFRLALIQFQRTTDEVAAEVQEELDTQLQGLLVSLKRATAGVEGLAGQLTVSAKSIDAELTALEQRLRAVQIAPDILAKEVAAVSAGMSTAAATFERRLAGAADKVDGRITVLFDSVARLPSVADVDVLAAQLNASAAKLTTQYGELEGVAGRAARRAGDFDRELQKASASASRLSGTIDAADRNAGQIHRAVHEVLAFIAARTGRGYRESTRPSKK